MDIRVLHLEPAAYGPEIRGLLESIAQVDYLDSPTQADFRARLQAAPIDAVFVGVGLSVGREELALAPELRWVVTPTTGLDHIDLDAMEERGVAVLSLKGHLALLQNVHATAEHAWALLLALVRQLPSARADVASGHWRRQLFLGTELHGRALGVVGYGRLGRMVAGYGTAFGMSVSACDIDDEQFTDAPATIRRADPDDLLATSDVVSIHLPLDDTTRGWLSASRIETMRRGSYLVNTARGELVDEQALIGALDRGHLAGAAVDVVADDSRWGESVPAGQPLLAYAHEHPEQVIVTPHIGGFARDSVESTRAFVVERFVDAAGQPRT